MPKIATGVEAQLAIMTSLKSAQEEEFDCALEAASAFAMQSPEFCERLSSELVRLLSIPIIHNFSSLSLNSYSAYSASSPDIP